MTEPHDPSLDAYVERLRINPEFLKAELVCHGEQMARNLQARYRYFTLDYVRQVLVQFQAPPLVDNPLAMRYIESELAIVDAQFELMQVLENHGYGVAGKSVLDIGCSNGALLLACCRSGAARATGVDIDEGRLARARQFLAEQRLAQPLDLVRADLLTEDLPARYGAFQVVLSTNVLEHVPDPGRFFAAVKRHIGRDREDNYALISVANRHHLSNVLSEPHYGLPGLVLLKREVAAALWDVERAKLNSSQPYEVFDWYRFDEYRTMARDNGLDATVLLDDRALAAFDPQTFDARAAARQHQATADAALDKVGLEERHRAILSAALRAYWEAYIEDHARADGTAEARRRLFVEYHTFLFRMVLKHAGSGRPRSVTGSPGRWLRRLWRPRPPA